MLEFAVFYGAVVQAIRAGIRKMRATKPKPLCTDCFHAHVQYGTKAQRAISCTYGGGVRPIKLDVLYCTDYCARTLPARSRAIGFVPEMDPAE